MNSLKTREFVGGEDITDLPESLKQKIRNIFNKSKQVIHIKRDQSELIFCRDFNRFFDPVVYLHTSPEGKTLEQWQSHLLKCEMQYRNRIKSKRSEELIETKQTTFSLTKDGILIRGFESHFEYKKTEPKPEKPAITNIPTNAIVSILSTLP